MAKTKRKSKPKSTNPFVSTLDRKILIDICKDGTISYRERGGYRLNNAALPVFSVDTVEDAKRLQARFCTLQYDRHPDPKGPEQWFVLPGFSGNLNELDVVTARLATFWAEHINKTAEAKRWAEKLRNRLIDKLQRQAAGLADSEAYELGRADERVNVGELLVAVEMVLREVESDRTGRIAVEAERVLRLVRAYRSDTDQVVEAGREKGWYPK